MRKKKRLTAIIILGLFFSMIAGTKLGTIGRANPLPGINPAISISTPQNTTYNEKRITINGSAAYNWNICSLVYSLDGKKRGSPTYMWIISREDANIGKNPPVMRTTLNFCTVLSNLAEGWHTVTFYLVSREVVVCSANTTFKIDSVSPEVLILSPLNETYNSSTVPMNFTVNEFVALGYVKYSLDEGENITITGNTNLTGLDNGKHNLTVYATDKAGNTGASETVFFGVAEPPEPLPTTMVIAPIAIVFVMSIGLLLYFKKHKR